MLPAFVALALAAAAAAIPFGVVPAPAAAAEIVVDRTDDPAIDDASVPGCSLRRAVQAVNDRVGVLGCPAGDRNDRIVLGAGTYELSQPRAPEPDGNTGGDLDLHLRPGSTATISGAGAAATTIDASGIPGDPSGYPFGDRALDVFGPGELRLAGLAITGGVAAPWGASGGAIRAGFSASDSPAAPPSLVLDEVELTGNNAGAGSPGGPGPEGPPGFPGVPGFPGGMGGDGGGVWAAGSLSIRASTLSGNRAGNGGHGHRPRWMGDPPSAGGAGGHGGAIYAVGEVAIEASTLSRNGAGNPPPPTGPGGPLPGGPGGSGGAIAHHGPQASLVNVTIAHNRAGAAVDGQSGGGRGGGIWSTGNLTLTAATLASNSAPGGAATIAGQATLAGSIVATEPGGCEGVTDGGGNLAFPAGTGCPGHIADPQLGPLQDNGGPTETMLIGSRSPARDLVDPTSAACPGTDQRGVARPQGRACDAGAVELGQWRFGKLARNARQGTARQRVHLPEPGRLILHRTSRVRGFVRQVNRARRVKLLVRPRGQAKRKLDRARRGGPRRSRARVRLRVSFVPIGGERSAQTRRVRLVKRR